MASMRVSMASSTAVVADLPGAAGNVAAIQNAATLDEEGKAMFGVPGPGAYETSTGLGRKTHQTLSKAPEMPFGTSRTNKTKHIGPGFEQGDFGKFSPGPVYRPAHQRTERRDPTVAFGLADRSTEALRYISPAHSQEFLGADTPGPGAHRRREGKGRAKTMGDAPTFVFGTEPQREPPFPRELLLHPDARYNLPETLANKDASPYRHAAAYTFSPHGKMSQGLNRSRDEAGKVWISEQHNKATAGVDTPGPGAYEKRSTLSSQKASFTDTSDHKLSRYGNPQTFSKKSLDGKQPYQGGSFAEADQTVPGHEYDTENNNTVRYTRSPDFSFGTATRFYRPELGGADAGPYLSKLHSKQSIGSQGPGPKYTLNGSIDEAAKRGLKFGKSQRADPTPLEAALVPGPGAYAPKPHIQYKAESCYSIASNRRSNMERKFSAEEPGPGTYNEHRNISRIKHVGSPGRGTFGRDGNRSSFMASPAVPGPGQYEHELVVHTSSPRRKLRTAGDASLSSTRDMSNHMHHMAPAAFSFGGKPKTPRKIHISAQHSAIDMAGIDSPGPGNYSHATSHPASDMNSTHRRSNRTVFTREKRGNDSVFISKMHSNASAPADTPGPGSYKLQGLAGNSNKYKNSGKFSFGTSVRPSLATVRF